MLIEETVQFNAAILLFSGHSKVNKDQPLNCGISSNKLIEIQWNAWRDLGIQETKEGAGGEAVGLFWIPSALNTKTMTRSYSRNAHYDRAATRKNFHLLPGYKVLRIEISKDLRAEGITIQSRDGNKKAITMISAKQEIVLAAGTFGSPTLLQRSGVGPKDVLKAADVEVKLDVPGVGRNLQDHAGSLLLYSCEITFASYFP